MSPTENHTVPPGWYPDPGGQRQWRAWNGRDWTGLTRPYGEVPPVGRSLDVLRSVHQLGSVGVVALFAGLGLLVSSLAHWPGTADPAPRWYTATTSDVAVALVLLGTVLYARTAALLGGRLLLAVVPGVNVLYAGALVATRVHGPGVAPRRLVGETILLVLFVVRAHVEPWLAVAPAFVALEHVTTLRALERRLVGPVDRAL